MTLTSALVLPARRAALAFVLGACATLAAGAALGQEPEALWRDIDLPRGFALDLGRARVSDRADEGRPVLAFSDGLLRANVPIRRLAKSDTGAPRARIEREEGQPVEELLAETGVELSFELGRDGWGYCRLLAREPERVRLEIVTGGDPRRRVLTRVPAALTTHSGPAGVALSWTGAELARDELYRVERRDLAQESASWEVLARVRETEWLDASAEPGRRFEYRVVADGSDFGSRARGVAGVTPESEPIALYRGALIDLVRGTADTGRFDLEVAFVGPNGVQLSPRQGVGLRLLTGPESFDWTLPDASGGTYREQRLFLAPGQALAAHLSDGTYARLVIEAEEDGQARLRRQVDLSGTRVFPAPPPAPEVVWTPARGVEFRFGNAALEDPRAARAAIVVEREQGFERDAWTELLRGEPGARELSEADVAELGLRRYRFRYVLAAGRSSLPGAVVAVVAGDDHGEGTERLIDAAVRDLAQEDYGRRARARGLLVELGERAGPRLEQALASEDPELSAAARAILTRAEGEARAGRTGAGPRASLLLAASAQAAGIEDGAPAGWLADERGARALALLCDLLGSGREPAGAAARERWRALLSEADPDYGVRLVASLIATLKAGRAARTPRIDLVAEGLRPRGVPDWDLVGLGLIDVGAAAADVAARVDLDEPWRALVRLQVLHDLARHDPARRAAVGQEEELAALRRALLAETLLARLADPSEPLAPADPRSASERAFFDAALGAVEDPVARLLGARDLAGLRLERCSGEPGSGGREVHRLRAPDSGELFELLESLARAGAQDVDLVLPPGVYAPHGDQSFLPIGLDGLRLVGEGRVVLRFGLAVSEGVEVIADGLHLAPVDGTAVTVTRATLLLRDCGIEASKLGVQGSGALIELERSAIVGGDSGAAGGIRLGGTSLLIARESRIEADSGAVYGARAAYLERCVAVGGTRNALSGPIDAELWLVDSLVEGQASALSAFASGILEGAVLLGGGAGLGEALFQCPLHVLIGGEPGDLAARPRLESCPLGR